MSWALFIDESGQDQHASLYEVLAGIAVEDRALWKLIRDLSDAQETIFGMRLFDAYGGEAKAQIEEELNIVSPAKLFDKAVQGTSFGR